MIYTHVAAFLAGLTLAAASTWHVQAWRYGGQISAIHQQHAQAIASSAKSALKLTEIYRENADAAIQKAEARAAQNKRDADGLRAELDGLRGDLADVPGRIRSATREAVNQYATAATVVFGDCAARYSELAGAATGHASDVQTLIDAWPAHDPNPAQPAH